MSVFRHPNALVESDDIGEGTRIWAFSHVMAGARIGRGCNIGEGCFIEKGAVLGDHVTIKNHVAVWDGVTIEDHVFIGPNASLTNDLRPRSQPPDWTMRQTHIRTGASIGANATLLCGIDIGSYALVGAGAVVTSSVGPHAVVYGNPARARGSVCRCAEPLAFRKGLAICRACRSRYRKDRRGQVRSEQ